MIEYTPRTTDALPVLSLDASVITLLTPADFEDVPYTPALLLRASFDASITSAVDYQEGCKYGFDDCLEMVVSDDPDTVKHCTSRSVVCSFVARNLCQDDFDLSSLAWRIGFVLGWLSALAVTNRSMASVGLDLLTVLVNRLQENV